jgi:alkaline phosphatase D
VTINYQSRSGRTIPYLELGPMIGHTTSTNSRIWAKASVPATLSVRIGLKEDLSDGRRIKGPRLETNTGLMNQVFIEKLQPSQRYYYCVLLDGKPAMSRPYPFFVTAPAEGTAGRVRFAFTSCVGPKGYHAAAGYADMAVRTNFDLLLMLGDNHYANTNNPVKQRAFYADQRQQAGWKQLTAATPTYAIWDDHDFGPDNSDGTMPGKELSLKTFREHWANPAYGERDHPGTYFKFTRANVDFFMLDVRYYRDPNKATNLAHKTMLGSAQLAWLKRELAASKAPVKVIASGSEFQSNGTEDSWKSFREERDDLFRFIEEQNIQGVLLISGDRHFTGAYQVQGKWIEVTCGPIGSANATNKNVAEMFLNFSNTKSKFYCIYDITTGGSEPKVTLEVYRVGEGLAERRTFPWDEVLGVAKIKTLPPPATVGASVKADGSKRTEEKTKSN